jgi:hypothetical protein
VLFVGFKGQFFFSFSFISNSTRFQQNL